MNKESIKYTKNSKGSKVFEKFLGKEEGDPGQVFARIDRNKFDIFKSICNDENISMAQGVEIGIDMLISYYEKNKSK